MHAIHFLYTIIVNHNVGGAIPLCLSLGFSWGFAPVLKCTQWSIENLVDHWPEHKADSVGAFIVMDGLFQVVQLRRREMLICDPHLI